MKKKKFRLLSWLITVVMLLGLMTDMNIVLATAEEEGKSTVEATANEAIAEMEIATIAEAKAGTNGQQFTVQGTVTFIDGGNVYIQDSTGGIDIYFNKDKQAGISIGDVIKITGKRAVYNGLIELAETDSYEKVGTSALPSIKVTIDDLLKDYTSGTKFYQSQRVLIEGATIGEINNSGNTPLTQGSTSINIYRLPTLSGIKKDDVVDIYAVVGAYNAAQLRVAKAEDVRLVGGSEDPVETMTLGKWAGTKAPTTTIVYGDKNEDNDYMDKSVELTLNRGGTNVIPAYSTSNYIGSSGFSVGDYYQFKLSSSLFGNINFSLKIRGSKTGPKNFKVLYSTTGVDFVDTGNKFSITKDGEYQSFSAALPTEAANSSTLYIRLAVADNISIKGESIQSGGTNYLNEVKITGSPVNSSDIVKIPVITPTGGEVILGQELTLTSETGGAKIYYSINGEEYKLYDSNVKPKLTVLPAEVKSYASKSGMTNSPIITQKYQQLKVASVNSMPNGGAVALNTKVTLATDTEEAAIYYSMDDGVTWKEYNAKEGITLETLPVNIKVKATKAGYSESEITTLSFTLRENDKYGVFFGQIHSHTSYSDGSGTVKDAFTYARDKAEQIDFLAVTDHSNSFDNEASASIADGSMSKEWVEGHRLADEFTNEGFVGIYGYEMTWSNGTGHMNTYNTKGFQSRTQSAYSNFATGLKKYYDTLKTDTGSLSQFNHPGETFGTFQDFGNYDENIDKLITMIEVGNGEGAIGSSGYFRSYDYYIKALDKGWHLAPTNNQDNHKGKWGDANTGRTVALLDNLNREEIYSAMRNMRIYATEDNDLSIYYTLNDNIMGTILPEGAVGATAKIKVDLKDPTDSKIGLVEVVVNGGLVADKATVDSKEKTVEFSVPEEYSYYFIRVTQPDGEIAVTAPVWVGEVEAAGISDLSTDTYLPVKNEAVDLDISLYNNEASPLVIESLEFKIGDTVIKKVDLKEEKLEKVDSMKTSDYTFNYTHNNAGKVEITAVLKGTINGIAKQYQKTLSLKYVPQEMVTRIIVDGSHSNDYVTGYYGGNMGNFSRVAADYSAQVEIIQDKLTAEDLKDADLLIVSAPARKTGTFDNKDYKPQHFSEEFIALVKGFADKGGTVILCGLADYQDTSDGQSSIEINKILSALGATSRINSDQMTDDVSNGGQSYRLYFTNFNSNSPFTKGIVAEQKYSAYSGSSIILNPEAVASGKVEYLIKGHPTTYVNNTKSFGGNFTNVEKGNVIALAREVLPNGSNVFVSGTVFMSNFEVAYEMDNIWDLPYSNKTIMENILKSVKSELEISTIKEAREGKIGDVFAVEGIVTAGTDNEKNTFFDAIYIEDDTAGITIFPYAEKGLKLGTKVKVIGYVDQYQGDKELQVIDVEILDKDNLKPKEAKKVSIKESMDYEAFGGSLLKVEGKISEIIPGSNSVISNIRIKDNEGNISNIFIDGYIGSGTTGEYLKTGAFKVGDTISAIGLLYLHPEGESEDSVPCLRVRNTDEIVLITEATPEEPEEPGDPEEPGNPQEPGKPQEPQKPQKPNKPESPKTGDQMPYGYIILGVVALGAAAVLIVTKKREGSLKN
ncbi:CehA/McbA family metallohydrolase [Alloiococcus sp. CFN-8]|uniref:CehA/McbA family metallohydrolase n=1 Tax=Alloiococcus sp. CFN-8 TaxID=3416081 RepID=UPI003CE7BA96